MSRGLPGQDWSAEPTWGVKVANHGKCWGTYIPPHGWIVTQIYCLSCKRKKSIWVRNKLEDDAFLFNWVIFLGSVLVFRWTKQDHLELIQVFHKCIKWPQKNIAAGFWTSVKPKPNPEHIVLILGRSRGENPLLPKGWEQINKSIDFKEWKQKHTPKQKKHI